MEDLYFYLKQGTEAYDAFNHGLLKAARVAEPLIIISMAIYNARGLNKIADMQGSGNDKIPWDTWENYEKVTVDGRQYAKVGNRLYSHHAVDRMQPSGNRYGSSIYQAGGDSGRSVAPQYVEDAIASAKPVVQANGNLSYTSGTLQVITNPEGAVVTIITH